MLKLIVKNQNIISYTIIIAQLVLFGSLYFYIIPYIKDNEMLIYAFLIFSSLGSLFSLILEADSAWPYIDSNAGDLDSKSSEGDKTQISLRGPADKGKGKATSSIEHRSVSSSSRGESSGIRLSQGQSSVTTSSQDKTSVTTSRLGQNSATTSSQDQTSEQRLVKRSRLPSPDHNKEESSGKRFRSSLPNLSVGESSGTRSSQGQISGTFTNVGESGTTRTINPIAINKDPHLDPRSNKLITGKNKPVIPRPQGNILQTMMSSYNEALIVNNIDPETAASRTPIIFVDKQRNQPGRFNKNRAWDSYAEANYTIYDRPLWGEITKEDIRNTLFLWTGEYCNSDLDGSHLSKEGWGVLQFLIYLHNAEDQVLEYGQMVPKFYIHRHTGNIYIWSNVFNTRGPNITKRGTLGEVHLSRPDDLKIFSDSNLPS